MALQFDHTCMFMSPALLPPFTPFIRFRPTTLAGVFMLQFSLTSSNTLLTTVSLNTFTINCIFLSRRLHYVAPLKMLLRGLNTLGRFFAISAKINNFGASCLLYCTLSLFSKKQKKKKKGLLYELMSEYVWKAVHSIRKDCKIFPYTVDRFPEREK